MNFWVSSKLEVILNILVNCSCPFYRHAKRSTINTEDVKLLARRSNSLVRDEFLSSLPFPIRIHYSQLITCSHEAIPQGTLH